MDKLLKRLTKDSGECQFPDNGKALTKIIEKIPNTPGVYIIYNSNEEIVYIGKAGTVNQDGTFKKQGLRKRLTNQHDGMRREDYFLSKIKKDGIAHIKIKWYELKDEVIPGYIEGMLIQEYLNIHKKLPSWNDWF